MPLDSSAGAGSLDLMVPALKCAGCMSRIEREMAARPGVAAVRANLTAHRVAIRFDPGLTDADTVIADMGQIGFPARPYDPALHGGEGERQAGDLLLRLGVAGFAAMNVMLLSVSVWSGADAATRDLLHWVSALIALPAIAYAGVPFFASALGVLSKGRLNMDVPISLAILLSAASSLFETVQSGQHAYFDAGVMLLFFLLTGRYLEQRTRAEARSAAAELAAMTGRTAQLVQPDGTLAPIPVTDLAPDMVLALAPGERMPADGIVAEGRSELDRSILTGESLPDPVAPGDRIHAGLLNLSGALRVRLTETGEDTVLAEIARMVDQAGRGRGRYDRLADRIARVYAPAVHILAALAFAGYIWATGDARLSLQVAVTVLIVTCPCALALAIPTVHTVASGRLFRDGIFLKDGAALERLAEIDTVVFDKTGTLTDGEPALHQAPASDSPAWPVAAALARQSRHPYSRAIAAAAAARGIAPAEVTDITEHPGCGVEGWLGPDRVRLGRGGWIGGEETDGVALSQGAEVAQFTFTETLRPGAVAACAALRQRGHRLVMLSGDTNTRAAAIAEKTGIDTWQGELLPRDKEAFLATQTLGGRRVLMVGDGLNDSPALAAAHASMSPASAADLAQASADLVFTRQSLDAVPLALDIAGTARRRAWQSLGIAAVYNSIAIPLAFAGMVTPLVAAAAMSTSSILVVLNALRLRLRRAA